MTGEGGRIQARQRGKCLTIPATWRAASAIGCIRPPFSTGREHRPLIDLGRRKPGLDGFDRPQPVAAGDGDLLPLPFLVGLAAADQDPVAVRGFHQIRDLEGAELGPAEGTRETKGVSAPGLFNALYMYVTMLLVWTAPGGIERARMRSCE